MPVIRVGVLGASGYVGSHTCRHLNESGHEVYAVSRSRTGSQGYGEPVLLDDFLAGEAPRVDVVVNCIGLAHGRYAEAEYERVEINLLRQILVLMRNKEIRKFLHVSSAAAQYGSNLYARYKKLGEQVVADNASGTVYTILRPTLIYGQAAPGHPAMLRKALSRNLPIPFQAIDTRKSVVYIENLMSAISAIIDHDWFDGKTFSVSDRGSIPLNRFIAISREAMGSQSLLLSVPAAFISAACRVGDLVDRAIVRIPVNRNLFDALMLDTAELENNLNRQIELAFETEEALQGKV